MKKLSIFLITAALIAGMVGCGPVQYNLTMAVAPGGGGTATDLTNASPYAAGTEVSIEAVANSGYWFVNWTAPAGTFDNANAPQTTFTMPAQNVMVTANFEPSEFYGGNGTAGDPYQIADWHQLDYVRNYLDSYFVLVNDLDSTTAGYTELASPTANQGAGWQPIGTEDQFFTGTFDGQGYEIRDLFINRPNEETIGLFSRIDEGVVIKNLGMVNANVTGGWDVGGLVGENDGTVSNSYANGTVVGIGHWVGGLLGGNEGTVDNCYSMANVTGNWEVGGLVGGNAGTVSNSYANGTVVGIGDWVGGLVGENDGTVSHSYSTGNVSGEGVAVVGGLVGGNAGTVSSSYATGSVTGDRIVGGLVGGDSGTVNDSYATGNVTGTTEVGGLMGRSGGTVSNSYSTGSVTGTSYVGGLLGYNYDVIVSNSFWDIQTSGQSTSAGGTGENTTQMQDIATFSGAGWNITAVANPDTRNPTYIWNIVNNVTYPFLSWQP